MPDTALILGIGNTLLCDDGAGVHALSHLARRLEGRRTALLLDGGTLSFTLLPTVETHARLIVLDAAELGLPPGSVQWFEGRAMDELLGRPRRSVHEVGLRDVLDMARLTDRLPTWRALVGIQPEIIDWSDAPSAAVLPALEAAADAAFAILDRWSRGGAPQDDSGTARLVAQAVAA